MSARISAPVHTSQNSLCGPHKHNGSFTQPMSTVNNATHQTRYKGWLYTQCMRPHSYGTVKFVSGDALTAISKCNRSQGIEDAKDPFVS